MLTATPTEKTCALCHGPRPSLLLGTEFREKDEDAPRILFRMACERCVGKDRHIVRYAWCPNVANEDSGLFDMKWGPNDDAEAHVACYADKLQTYSMRVLHCPASWAALQGREVIYYHEPSDTDTDGSDLSSYSESSDDEEDLCYVPKKKKQK